MCLGSSDVSVKTPKADPLPDPIPAPPPPEPVQAAKLLTDADDAPDIRIGAAKDKKRTTSSSATTASLSSDSLKISDNQGLNI